MITSAGLSLAAGQGGPRWRSWWSATVIAFALAAGVVTGGALAPAALGKGVQPRFDRTDPAGGPFPSDRFTVSDSSQLTGLRVNLPKPNCTTRRSDCDDVDVLNELD